MLLRSSETVNVICLWELEMDRRDASVTGCLSVSVDLQLSELSGDCVPKLKKKRTYNQTKGYFHSSTQNKDSSHGIDEDSLTIMKFTNVA